MRCLKRTVQSQFAVDLVHRGNTATGLQRTGMGAVVVHHFFSNHRRVRQNFIGRILVTLLPCEYMVGVATRAMRTFGRIRDVFTQYRCIR